MSIANITDKNVSFDEKALRAERENPSPPRVTRRTLLRGTAAAVALPALDSLLRPSRAEAQAKPPIRFVAWHIGCGVWGPSWFPTTTGETYVLPPSLASLEKTRSKVLVMSGIQNTPACNPQGSHGCGPPAMTTCRQGTKPLVGMGISVDQVYAQALGKATRIPSLQLSVTDRIFPDVGYPAVYNGTLAWTGPTQPLPPVITPDLIFDKLFSGVTGPTTDPAVTAALAKRKALRTSVLDFVFADAKRLQPRLGASDVRKLDEYMTSIRAVETEIQNVSTPGADACTPMGMVRPPNKVADVPTLTRIMLDLMVLGFQCDATRVITFQQGNGGPSSFTRLPWINITEDHHTLSHHQLDPVKGAKLAAIDKWEVEQYAYFIDKMNAINEGGGTLLDNSLIFLSSEIADGNRHNQQNKPILLAGSAGGQIKTGRHAIFQDEAQADFFIALLNMMGVQATTFGLAGTKPMSGLT